MGPRASSESIRQWLVRVWGRGSGSPSPSTRPPVGSSLRCSPKVVCAAPTSASRVGRLARSRLGLVDQTSRKSLSAARGWGQPLLTVPARPGVDLILQVEGSDVGTMDDLQRLLNAHAIDRPTAVTVFRGGRTINLVVILTESPVQEHSEQVGNGEARSRELPRRVGPGDLQSSLRRRRSWRPLRRRVSPACPRR